MNLFEECMEALGIHAKTTPNPLADKILSDFDAHFPLNGFGRIDWKKISKKIPVKSLRNTFEIITKEFGDTLGDVFIIGSDPTIPIITTKFDKIFEHIDDVEAMSPNTWLYCPAKGWIIELYHDGEITLGLI